MTGPALPPGGEELREALMKWLSARVGGMCWDEAPWQEWGDEADELLALPAVRDALAAQKKMWSYANDPAPTSQQLRDLVIRNRELEQKLRRVERLAEAWEGKGESGWRQFRRALAHDYDSHLYARVLRRALDGDS